MDNNQIRSCQYCAYYKEPRCTDGCPSLSYSEGKPYCIQARSQVDIYSYSGCEAKSRGMRVYLCTIKRQILYAESNQHTYCTAKRPLY